MCGTSGRRHGGSRCASVSVSGSDRGRIGADEVPDSKFEAIGIATGRVHRVPAKEFVRRSHSMSVVGAAPSITRSVRKRKGFGMSCVT
jgi:hypothetical protein